MKNQSNMAISQDGATPKPLASLYLDWIHNWRTIPLGQLITLARTYIVSPPKVGVSHIKIPK